MISGWPPNSACKADGPQDSTARLLACAEWTVLLGAAGPRMCCWGRLGPTVLLGAARPRCAAGGGYAPDGLSNVDRTSAIQLD